MSSNSLSNVYITVLVSSLFSVMAYTPFKLSIIFVIIFISELILCTALLTAFLLGSATSCGRFSIRSLNCFLALVILLLANFLLFRTL